MPVAIFGMHSRNKASQAFRLQFIQGLHRLSKATTDLPGVFRMRLPDENIKTSILHPEGEIRLTALSHFADSFSLDPTIMPLVIQAFGKYGRASSFAILRKAEDLVQSASTFDWLIDQLRRNFDTADIEGDNLRFAIALDILAAPIDLLKSRKSEVDGLASFPETLRSSFEQRLQMMTWGLEQGWEALEELGRKTMRRGDWTLNQTRYAFRIIESLSQYPDQRGDMVLALLSKDLPERSDVITWLEPEIVALAGQMRLVAAIPILVEHLHSDNLALADAATTALRKIGNDAVVEAIADDWWEGSDDFRGGAADVLESIHTDLCVSEVLKFFDEEEDMDTAVALGHGLLSHFEFYGIEPVRELVLEGGDELSPDLFDLRYHLVAAATIMEIEFPAYEEWYDEAIETNWGWDEFEHPRLADAFQLDPVGPKRSGNGNR